MSIFPEKIVKTRGSDGTSFTSEIYSLENWANLGILGFAIAAFFILSFIPLLSALMLLLFCMDIDSDDKPYGLCIFGILISFYILVDINNGWIVSKILHFFYDKDKMHYVINLNLASLITCVVALIFSNTIFFMSAKNNFISFIYIAVIFFIAYLFSDAVLSNIIKLQ